MYTQRSLQLQHDKEVGQENSIVIEDIDPLSPKTTAVPQQTVSAQCQRKIDN